MAVAEFAIGRELLRKRLTLADIQPGKDGKYSTGQITEAVFGSLEEEKLRKMKAEATSAEIQAAIDEGRVILATDAKERWDDAITRARQTVEHAGYLDDAQKTRLIEDLAAIKLQDASCDPS